LALWLAVSLSTPSGPFLSFGSLRRAFFSLSSQLLSCSFGLLFLLV
jgi:hypothetical protein